MYMCNVAIIILNYMSWKDTLEEVKICHKVLGFSSEQIIVVDNMSPNESAEQLEKNSSNNYIFLLSKKNSGYAAGNNIGLKYAFDCGFKYGWILNNDIIISDKFIVNKLLNVFQKEPNVAVVNPDVYTNEGTLYNRDSIRPTFFDYTFGLAFYRYKGRHVDDRGGYGFVYRPQGCCMIIDLKKLNEVGYMDEYTFLYGEEPILAERFLKKGYKCACCIETSIIHNHSKTVKKYVDKYKLRKMCNKNLKYLLCNYRKYSRFAASICCFFNSVKMLILE